MRRKIIFDDFRGIEATIKNRAFIRIGFNSLATKLINLLRSYFCVVSSDVSFLFLRKIKENIHSFNESLKITQLLVFQLRA